MLSREFSFSTHATRVVLTMQSMGVVTLQKGGMGETAKSYTNPFCS